MSALKKEDLPAYTYEDYQHWEGDWELIEGIPYAIFRSEITDSGLTLIIM